MFLSLIFLLAACSFEAGPMPASQASLSMTSTQPSDDGCSAYLRDAFMNAGSEDAPSLADPEQFAKQARDAGYDCEATSLAPETAAWSRMSLPSWCRNLGLCP